MISGERKAIVMALLGLSLAATALVALTGLALWLGFDPLPVDVDPVEASRWLADRLGPDSAQIGSHRLAAVTFIASAVAWMALAVLAVVRRWPGMAIGTRRAVVVTLASGVAVGVAAGAWWTGGAIPTENLESYAVIIAGFDEAALPVRTLVPGHQQAAESQTWWPVSHTLVAACAALVMLYVAALYLRPSRLTARGENGAGDHQHGAEDRHRRDDVVAEDDAEDQ